MSIFQKKNIMNMTKGIQNIENIQEIHKGSGIFCNLRKFQNFSLYVLIS